MAGLYQVTDVTTLVFSISYVVGTVMLTKYSTSSPDVFQPPFKLGLCDSIEAMHHENKLFVSLPVRCIVDRYVFSTLSSVLLAIMESCVKNIELQD